jgi:hypothetical protein
MRPPIECPTISIDLTDVCDRMLSIFRWMRNADARMSRLLKAPRLNEKTVSPAAASRR